MDKPTRWDFLIALAIALLCLGFLGALHVGAVALQQHSLKESDKLPKFPLHPALYFLAPVAHAAEHPPCWGDTSDFRSSTTKYHFFKEHPCPGGPDAGSVKRCQGYVIDHVCPLECCGKDDLSNMQWQTLAEAKAKDKWEGQCSLSCRAKEH